MGGHRPPARIARRVWLGGLASALALLAAPAAAQSSPGAPPARLPRGPELPPRSAPAPPDLPVPMVSIQVCVPAEAVPDEELTYRITVTNCSRAAAHHVIVRNPLPTGVRFVRATPDPTKMSPVLLWELGTLAPCARREITLVVNPTADAEVQSCARVQFEYGQCVRTRIARPALRLVKTGPARALLYRPIPFQLVVTNTGRAPARNVKLTDTLPDWVDLLNSKPANTGGDALTWDLGDLRPGETRRVEYLVAAKKVGAFTNRAVVEARGGLRQESSATVEVGEAALAVLKAGPRQRLVGRPATYHLTVRNPGTMPASDVRLADVLPADIIFISASDGGRLEGRQVRWSLGTLSAGASRTVRLVVRARQAGRFINVVTATAEGLLKRAEVETRFVNAAGLAAEVDKRDPLTVGRDGTYAVRILNAGKVEERNVGVVVEVPEGLRVLDARGPTASERDGRRIRFAPLARLAPGVEVTYTLRVRAERAGEVQLQVEVTADGAGPVRVEEPTTIQEAPPRPPASSAGRRGEALTRSPNSPWSPSS